MDTRSSYSLSNLNVGVTNITFIIELNQQERRKDKHFSSKMKNLRPRFLLIVYTRGVLELSDLASKVWMGDFVEEMLASTASENFWVFLQKRRETIGNLKLSCVLNDLQPAGTFQK